MDLLLRDKVVWITGAAGGIGRALALEFAAEGARLALHANRSFDALEEWVRATALGDHVLCLAGDVRDADGIESAADAIAQRFGRIDVCVANAGVWPPEDRSLDEMPAERLQETIAVNLLGAMHTARGFLRVLRATGPRPDGHGAALTFVGSTAARFGERFHSDYAASKAGLVGAMLSLKNEVVLVDPAARVNVVHPGWTVTHMARPALAQPGVVERVTGTMALRQLARAKDIARAVVVLSSARASSHVTGEVLTVAGGMEGRSLWEAVDLERDAILARLERD